MSVNKVPYKQPFLLGLPNIIERIWHKWFLSVKSILDNVNAVVVTDPTSPYTVENENEIIFITTTTAFIVNLKKLLNGRRCRVINMPASTANVSLTPNGADLLYGVNASDTILPGEARDVDSNSDSSKGWY